MTAGNLSPLAALLAVLCPLSSVLLAAEMPRNATLKTADELDCVSVAPKLGTPKKMIDKAHRQGLSVCLWMVQDLEAWKTAKAKGADRITSDYPHLLDCAVRGNRKKLVAMDLDATLCQPRSPVPWKNLKALEALGKRYRCVMIGADDASRICSQMGEFPIDIVGMACDKYDATLAWAKDRGYSLEDIVFVGDDFADGGDDSHVRLKGMDRIVINDFRNFASAVSVLLK